MSATATHAGYTREPVRIGNDMVTFFPHYLPGVGPRVFVILDNPRAHDPRNYSPDDARLFADRLKMAACEAEAIAKRERMRRKTA